MDMVAGGIAFWFIFLALLWSMLGGLCGGFLYRKTGSLSAASLAGLVPLACVWLLFAVVHWWPDIPDVKVVDGKAVVPESLPSISSSLSPPVPPTSDPANFDSLKSFGLEDSAIDLCRKKGCRAVFEPSGLLSSFGPIKNGDWAYEFDRQAGRWKLKP